MKIRKVTSMDPTERLAVSVRQSVLQQLDAYQAHYLKTYGEPIERSQLVEEMLRDYMNSDKAFMKAMQSAPVPPSASAQKAPSERHGDTSLA